jgi:hypothetical protein
MIKKATFNELVKRLNWYHSNPGPWDRLPKLRFGQMFCNCCLNPLEEEIPKDLFEMVDDQEAIAFVLLNYVEPTRQDFFMLEGINGRPFAAKILRKGDAYGLNDCLVWQNDHIGVEFYDFSYSNVESFGYWGQYMSRYFVESILDVENQGLCLEGCIPEWNINSSEMLKVRVWLKKMLDV